MGLVVHLTGRDVVERTQQTAPSHLFGILQLEGPAGGIAGIGEKRLFIYFPFPVQPIE